MKLPAEFIAEELDTTRKAVISLCEIALTRGIAPSAVGKAACNDSALVFKLRAGHNFRLDTLKRARTNLVTLLNSTTIPSFLQETA